MPIAKKLPSGSWRCQVYSHSIPLYNEDGSPKLDKNGKPAKKKIYESFTSGDTSRQGKYEAERLANEFLLKRDIENNPCKMTLGMCMDEYIESRSAILSPSTIREYKRSRKKDMQRIMDIPICDLTQKIIQEEINREALTHSPKTIKNMHGLLSAVLGSYRPNFALKTNLPKRVRPKIYVPTDGEIKALMKFAKGDILEIPILLAAFGPMRRGEICALDSTHVYNNTVHVEYSMALNENNEWVIKRPKSYAGDRYIEFPDFVIHKIKNKSGRIVDLNPAQVSDRFSDILKRAGIKHFRFHDLRHYSASIQHAIGIPDVYIMQRGGWGNDGVLKSVYRHTIEEKTKEMNHKANDYFSKIVSHEISHEKE